ncbi:MAG: biotin transporter BioY [Clostridia bacterium]|nr:biotin transporter BioY [Clostridia bacterium]
MAGSGTKKLRIVDMAYIALFAALMAVCSWISIPATVPFTLQTFGVFLAVSVLGGRRGTLAVLVYLLLGMIGIPVFAGFQGGIGCLLGTTGGYIIGFLLSALVMWAMERLPFDRKWTLTLSMVAGLVVCYAFGTAWFMAVYAKKAGEIGLMTALGWCVFPFIIPDLLKIALARIISRRLAAAIRLQ